MPNEVYRRTRAALATLVSERAATRVLNEALRHVSLSADSLDEGAVRKLLLGPVQRELEGILPRTGLRRTLRRLARQVADGAPARAAGATPANAPSPTPSETPATLHPVRRSSVYLPDVPVPGAARRDVPPSPTPGPGGVERDASSRGGGREAAPAAAAVAVVDGGADGAPAARSRSGHRPGPDARARADDATSPGPAPTVVPKALPPEALDRLTVRFAEIEGVNQVIGLRDRHETPHVRGEGIDPDALAPLAHSAIRLLGRHGPLRSLVLEHGAGLLFVFPLGRDAVAVLAEANVNMGAVFAARAALEEAQ